MKSAVLSLFFLLLLQNTYAIRNGDPAIMPEHVVTLEVHKDLYTCLGLRISKNYVVTAAHCMKNANVLGIDRKDKNTVRIRYIDNGRKKSKRTRTKKAIIKSRVLSEELAVLRIDSNNENFKAPVISKDSSDLYLKHNLFYGLTINKTRSMRVGSIELKTGYLDSIETPQIKNYTMLVMKPGEKNQQPCGGDSGGPVFTPEGKALGLVSFIEHSTKSIINLSTDEQCQVADRSYFIYLSEHLDFLEPYLDATNLP